MGDALHGLGRVAEAGQAYRKGLALRLKLEEIDATMENRAGLARVHIPPAHTR